MLHGHAVKCFCLIILFFFPLGFQTAENRELTEQDVLSILILWPHMMARTITKTIRNCALLYYIVQFIFRRCYQHWGTDKFNKKNHNVPVSLIVIKRKLSPGDSLFLFNSPTYSGGAFGEHRKSSHTVHHKDKPNSKVDEESFEFQIKSFVF